MKTLFVSLFFAISANAALFSKSFNVVCDVSRPPVKLVFSSAISTDSLTCEKVGSRYEFRLKNDLFISLGEAEYFAPKSSLVLLHGEQFAIDKSCDNVHALAKSAVLSFFPKSLPEQRYSIALDVEGNAFVSQMQTVACRGKAE